MTLNSIMCCPLSHLMHIGSSNKLILHTPSIFRPKSQQPGSAKEFDGFSMIHWPSQPIHAFQSASIVSPSVHKFIISPIQCLSAGFGLFAVGFRGSFLNSSPAKIISGYSVNAFIVAKPGRRLTVHHGVLSRVDAVQNDNTCNRSAQSEHRAAQANRGIRTSSVEWGHWPSYYLHQPNPNPLLADTNWDLTYRREH